MLKTRVIPCLLLRRQQLVKTVNFKAPTYVGDPINAVRLFNEKEVDELIFLDIGAADGDGPPMRLISELAGECFMPVCYGGGIRTVEQVRDILKAGVEKVSINSHAAEDPTLIRRAADLFGSQSVVASIDVKQGLLGGYHVMTRGGRKAVSSDPISYAEKMEQLGAGEILLNSISRDGTMQGYDLQLVKQVADAVSIPVIACGGAGSVQHFRSAAKDGGAAAVAAGSMFVFHGKHRAVLISYPARRVLEEVLG